MDVHENDISAVTMKDQSLQNEFLFYTRGPTPVVGSSLDRLKSNDFRQVPTNRGGMYDKSTGSDDEKKPAAQGCRSTRARNGIKKQKIEVSSD